MWRKYKDYRYEPFWQEWEDEIMSSEHAAYCQGHEEGYSKGVEDTKEYNKTSKEYEQRIDQLENLISANYRTMKADILRQLGGSNVTSERTEEPRSPKEDQGVPLLEEEQQDQLEGGSYHKDRTPSASTEGK